MEAQAKDLEAKKLSLIQIKKKQDSMYRMRSNDVQDGSRVSRTKRNALIENLHPDRLPTINTALAVVSQLPSSYKDYHLRASQASENSQ